MTQFRSVMDLFNERAAEAGLPVADEISFEDIETVGLPVVVQCATCSMTMPVLLAKVANNGRIYCGDCADEHGGLNNDRAWERDRLRRRLAQDGTEG